MSGPHKPGEFGRRNQGDIARPSSSNNNRLLPVYHLVKHGGEVLAETSYTSFRSACHPRIQRTALLYVPGFSNAGEEGSFPTPR